MLSPVTGVLTNSTSLSKNSNYFLLIRCKIFCEYLATLPEGKLGSIFSWSSFLRTAIDFIWWPKKLFTGIQLQMRILLPFLSTNFIGNINWKSDGTVNNPLGTVKLIRRLNLLRCMYFPLLSCWGKYNWICFESLRAYYPALYPLHFLWLFHREPSCQASHHCKSPPGNFSVRPLHCFFLWKQLRLREPPSQRSAYYLVSLHLHLHSFVQKIT